MEVVVVRTTGGKSLRVYDEAYIMYGSANAFRVLLIACAINDGLLLPLDI